MTELEENTHSIRVVCIASTHAKTGVEMEALAGVNAALLTIWDLTKMVEADLMIDGVRLLAKVGGKSGLWLNPAGIPEWVKEKVAPKPAQTLKGIAATFVTLSDRAAAGIYEDKATPVGVALLESLGATIHSNHVIPDEPAELTRVIKEIQAEGKARLIITSGGTGVAPRDKHQKPSLHWQIVLFRASVNSSDYTGLNSHHLVGVAVVSVPHSATCSSLHCPAIPRLFVRASNASTSKFPT